MKVIADAGGTITGGGLADVDAIKAAAALGLILVESGNAWTLADTVSLSPRQRLNMGLPPVVQAPSVASAALAYVAAAFRRTFRARVS